MKKRNKSFFKLSLVLVILFTSIAFAGCQRNDMTNSKEIISKLKGMEVTVYKSPSCGCCVGYIKALESIGAKVTVISDDSQLMKIKEELNIPRDMQSCHTSVYGNGYFVEGHVPFEAVEKIIEENPQIEGIAMPGMPAGSIGMGGQKRGDFVIYSISDGKASEYFRV